MPFCRDCGSKVNDSMKFCPECGSTQEVHNSTQSANIEVQDSVISGDVNIIQNTGSSQCLSCNASNVIVMECSDENCNTSFCELCHPGCRLDEDNLSFLNFDSGRGSGPFCQNCLDKFKTAEENRLQEIEDAELAIIGGKEEEILQLKNTLMSGSYGKTIAEEKRFVKSFKDNSKTRIFHPSKPMNWRFVEENAGVEAQRNMAGEVFGKGKSGKESIEKIQDELLRMRNLEVVRTFSDITLGSCVMVELEGPKRIRDTKTIEKKGLFGKITYTSEEFHDIEQCEKFVTKAMVIAIDVDNLLFKIVYTDGSLAFKDTHMWSYRGELIIEKHFIGRGFYKAVSRSKAYMFDKLRDKYLVTNFEDICLGDAIVSWQSILFDA